LNQQKQSEPRSLSTKLIGSIPSFDAGIDDFAGEQGQDHGDDESQPQPDIYPS
jgi:hypothetical protein